MSTTLNFLSVSRSWAIHFIDMKNSNVIFNFKTPSKQVTSTLSELPYFCPGKLKQLSPCWTSRNLHVSINNSFEQEYIVECKCTKVKNDDNYVSLYLATFECDTKAYATIVDANGEVWCDHLCLIWNDKTNPDSLWQIGFSKNIPQDTQGSFI